MKKILLLCFALSSLQGMHKSFPYMPDSEESFNQFWLDLVNISLTMYHLNINNSKKTGYPERILSLLQGLEKKIQEKSEENYHHGYTFDEVERMKGCLEKALLRYKKEFPQNYKGLSPYQTQYELDQLEKN